MNVATTQEEELAELVKLSLRRELSAAELARYYVLHGVDAESAEIYAEAGGRPIDVGDQHPV